MRLHCGEVHNTINWPEVWTRVEKLYIHEQRLSFIQRVYISKHPERLQGGSKAHRMGCAALGRFLVQSVFRKVLVSNFGEKFLNDKA